MSFRTVAALAMTLLLPVTPARAQGAAPIEPGEVAHLVATYDGSNLVLYVDGKEAARTAIAGRPESNAKAPLEIGSYLGRKAWPGGIDEVAIYDRALTPADVQEHFRAGSSTTGRYRTVIRDTDGVVGAWPLGDAGRTQKDAVGRANGRAPSVGVTFSAPALVAGAADDSVALDGRFGNIRVARAPELTQSLSVEAWATAGKAVADRFIVSRINSYFIGTNALGYVTAGVWAGGKSATATAKTAFRRVGAPPAAAGGGPAAGAGGKSGGDGDSTNPTALIVLGVIAALGLLAAVVPAVRSRLAAREDDDGVEEGPGAGEGPGPEPVGDQAEPEPAAEEEAEPAAGEDGEVPGEAPEGSAHRG